MSHSQDPIGILHVYSTCAEHPEPEKMTICQVFQGDNYLKLSPDKQTFDITNETDPDSLFSLILPNKDDYNIEDLGKSIGIYKNPKDHKSRLRPRKVFELQVGKPFFVHNLQFLFFPTGSETYDLWKHKKEEKERECIPFYQELRDLKPKDLQEILKQEEDRKKEEEKKIHEEQDRWIKEFGERAMREFEVNKNSNSQKTKEVISLSVNLPFENEKKSLSNPRKFMPRNKKGETMKVKEKDMENEKSSSFKEQNDDEKKSKRQTREVINLALNSVNENISENEKKSKSFTKVQNTSFFIEIEDDKKIQKEEIKLNDKAFKEKITQSNHQEENLKKPTPVTKSQKEVEVEKPESKPEGKNSAHTISIIKETVTSSVNPHPQSQNIKESLNNNKKEESKTNKTPLKESANPSLNVPQPVEKEKELKSSPIQKSQKSLDLPISLPKSQKIIEPIEIIEDDPTHIKQAPKNDSPKNKDKAQESKKPTPNKPNTNSETIPKTPQKSNEAKNDLPAVSIAKDTDVERATNVNEKEDKPSLNPSNVIPEVNEEKSKTEKNEENNSAKIPSNTQQNEKKTPVILKGQIIPVEKKTPEKPIPVVEKPPPNPFDYENKKQTAFDEEQRKLWEAEEANKRSGVEDKKRKREEKAKKDEEEKLKKKVKVDEEAGNNKEDQKTQESTSVTTNDCKKGLDFLQGKKSKGLFEDDDIPKGKESKKSNISFDIKEKEQLTDESQKFTSLKDKDPLGKVENMEFPVWVKLQQQQEEKSSKKPSKAKTNNNQEEPLAENSNQKFSELFVNAPEKNPSKKVSKLKSVEAEENLVKSEENNSVIENNRRPHLDRVAKGAGGYSHWDEDNSGSPTRVFKDNLFNQKLGESEIESLDMKIHVEEMYEPEDITPRKKKSAANRKKKPEKKPKPASTNSRKKKEVDSDDMFDEDRKKKRKREALMRDKLKKLELEIIEKEKEEKNLKKKEAGKKKNAPVVEENSKDLQKISKKNADLQEKLKEMSAREQFLEEKLKKQIEEKKNAELEERLQAMKAREAYLEDQIKLMVKREANAQKTKDDSTQRLTTKKNGPNDKKRPMTKKEMELEEKLKKEQRLSKLGIEIEEELKKEPALTKNESELINKLRKQKVMSKEEIALIEKLIKQRDFGGTGKKDETTNNEKEQTQALAKKDQTNQKKKEADEKKKLEMDKKATKKIDVEPKDILKKTLANMKKTNDNEDNVKKSAVGKKKNIEADEIVKKPIGKKKDIDSEDSPKNRNIKKKQIEKEETPKPTNKRKRKKSDEAFLSGGGESEDDCDVYKIYVQSGEESESKESAKKTTKKITKVPQKKATTTNLFEDKSPKNPKFRILCSGFTFTNPETRSLKSLGITTHDDKNKPFDMLIMKESRRTIKFLLALTRGIPIVDSSWIEESLKKNTLLNYESYIVVDKESEKFYHYSLKESLEKRKKDGGFLNRCKIWIPNNIKPDYKDIKMLIKESGGDILPEIYKGKDKRCFNIMNEKDKDAEKYMTQGYQIHSIELLYTGILRQQVDGEAFLLK